LILTTKGHLLTSGANDKYQLGIDPDKRNMKIFNFTEVVNFKTGERFEKYQKQEDVKFKDIQCWNLNAAIDA
jgi:alpha-tubulin suppressor-like RCC1 family protein